MLSDKTLVYWINHHAHAKGEHKAIVFGDQSLSYSALNDASRRFANGLKGLGIAKGDVVAVQLPNVPEFIIAYLAICRIGAVMQTLHMPYRGADLSQLLGSSNARAVICLHSFKDLKTAEELVQFKQKSALEHVIVLGEGVNGAESYHELAQSKALDVDYEAKRDDVYLLLYTSGTTASPKGVPIRYRNFIANAYWSVKELGIGADDCILSLAPMTHLYGLFAFHVSLLGGAVCSLLPAFTAVDFAKLLETHQPTGVFAAPAHMNRCIAENLLSTEKLNNTRFICLSGSAVAPQLAETVDKLMNNGSVIQLWGMSELQAGSFGRLTDPPATRYNTAGRVSPNTKLRIVDEDGQVMASGEKGEIQVSGPSVFSAYLNNPQESAKAFSEDGWFRTGDLGTIDELGYLQLSGRTKDIINRGGIKYNPLDVEEIIDRMEGVQRSAIIPVADAVMGEKACVFIELMASATISLEDIKAHLAAADIAKFKWPEMVEIIDEMPLTPTQKVIRGKLKAGMHKC